MNEVIELVKEIKDEIKGISHEQTRQGVFLEKNEESINKMVDKIDNINKENIIQTKDIAENKESLVEHMKQTTLVRELVEQNKNIVKKELKIHEIKGNERLLKLEAPKKFRKQLLDILLKVGGGAGAAYAIVRMYDYVKTLGWFS